MSAAVARAKFKVMEIRRSGSPGPNEMGTIVMRPVTGGSPENESFYRWSPGGELTLSTVNERVVAALGLGEEFYLDFIPAKAQSETKLSDGGA